MTSLEIHTKTGKTYYLNIADAKDLYAALRDVFAFDNTPIDARVGYAQWVDTSPRTGEAIMGTECQSERE